jgi:hypothetical protein
MFQTKFAEKFKSHISCSVTFFGYRVVYEVMWKYTVEPDRPQIIWRMRVTCLIPNAANTRSEYAVLIAFPLKEWLYERASVLRHAYIGCLLVLRSVSTVTIRWSVSEGAVEERF